MQALILVNGEIRDECIATGIQALRQGAPAIDTAELVARAVESDPGDHSVGFSGLPNILGEVELDASIMDGATLASGAVAALQGYLHPISVARQVMERLPHVLLAGAGASRFAREIGAEAGNLLTHEAAEIWLKRLRAVAGKNGLALSDADFQSPQAVASALAAENVSLIGLIEPAMKYHEGGDTMNVIVRDASGHIVSAVTTSGVAWKYPGRVGDSPIINAGNYADDRYGAAVCTGMGELTIRHGTALRAVLALQRGLTLEQAGRETIHDLLHLSTPQNAWIRLLLVDRYGNVGGYCTRPGSQFKVQFMDEDQPRTLMSEAVV